MTAVGVFNGNWRGEEMREYLNGIRSDGKKLVELGSCGHELKSRPLWMVGKSQLCYSCYCEEEQDQRRLVETITEEAQAEYFAADSACAELDPRITRRESILAAFRDEPLNKTEAAELYAELAEIDQALQFSPSDTCNAYIGAAWEKMEEIEF